MKCLAVALSRLLGRDVLPDFEIVRPVPPWCGADLVYVALSRGVHLLPLPASMQGVDYEKWYDYYEAYHGILCGDLPDGRHHAYAKMWKLWDGNEIVGESPYGGPYNSLKNRVFFAWMNNKANTS